MIAQYLITTIVIGFAASFFGVPNIIYSLIVMMRNGTGSAYAVALGSTVVQIIWAIIAVVVIAAAGHLETTMNGSYWDEFIVAIILLFLAYKFITADTDINTNESSANESISNETSKHQLLKCFGVGFLLSITAPQRLLGYILFMSAANVHLLASMWWPATVSAIGILIGVCAFWILILTLFKCIRSKANDRLIKTLYMIGGIIMALFGLFSLFDGLRQVL